MARSPATVATLVAVPLALVAGASMFFILRDDGSAQENVRDSTAPVPVQTPAVNPDCAPIVDALPAKLNEQYRRLVKPRHPQIVAWGDPAIVLRCGVEPKERTGTEQLIGVNGVEWVAAPQGKNIVWTTVSLPTPVEVLVPAEYAEDAAANILNPLAQPLLPS